MLYAKIGWNWSSGSTEEEFLISSMYFSYFIIISPLKIVAIHLNKLKSPSPKDAKFQVWLELALWFLRRWKCENFTDDHSDDNGQQINLTEQKKLIASFEQIIIFVP